MTSICEKKVRQKYGLFMQNKCLYRILSLCGKPIDTAADSTTQAKNF